MLYEDNWVKVKDSVNYDLRAIQWRFIKNHLLIITQQTKYINFGIRTEMRFYSNITYKCIKCLGNLYKCSADCAVVGQADQMEYL